MTRLWDRLTERERRVAQLAAEGLSNAEIGAKLLISEDGVKTQMRGLFRKTGAKDRTQVVYIVFVLNGGPLEGAPYSEDAEDILKRLLPPELVGVLTPAEIFYRLRATALPATDVRPGIRALIGEAGEKAVFVKIGCMLLEELGLLYRDEQRNLKIVQEPSLNEALEAQLRLRKRAEVPIYLRLVVTCMAFLGGSLQDLASAHAGLVKGL